MKILTLHILETPQEMLAIEELQHLLWPGTDRDIVPDHMLVAAVHNGGLVIGAVEIDAEDELAGEPAADRQEFLDRSNPPSHAEPLPLRRSGLRGVYSQSTSGKGRFCW